MIAYKGLLVQAAEDAKIAIPKDLDDYKASEYPHWHVYCLMQIGRPCPSAGCHFDNAKIISKCSIEQLINLTYREILDLGFV